MGNNKIRHICGLSGGKDSAALAIYLRDKIPDMEYFFCDTGYELPEVYAYLNRLEAFLGKPIKRLDNEGRGFEHYLIIYNNYLPSANSRWCTRHLKLEPMERFIGGDMVNNYVAIRSDEGREGYSPTKPNIKTIFPFKDAGYTILDVIRLLENSGLEFHHIINGNRDLDAFFAFPKENRMGRTI